MPAEMTEYQQVLVELAKIKTLLGGENGGGIMKRVAHHGQQIDQLNEDMVELQTQYRDCSYDSKKCADHDKRISVNGVKIALITTGSSVGTGSIIATIMKFTGA